MNVYVVAVRHKNTTRIRCPSKVLSYLDLTYLSRGVNVSVIAVRHNIGTR